MRDLYAWKRQVTDPLTGSELAYQAYDTSKEGGYVLRFAFRQEQSGTATPFRVLLSPYTALEADSHRAKNGLPELQTGLSRRQYIQLFAEEFGMYFAVTELDLLEPFAFARDKSKSTPDCWLVDWAGLSAATANGVVEALARTVFLAWSRKPDSVGFYPDHLTINPYHMPGQFVLRVQADVLMGSQT